jgi:hypothetical protein
MNRFVDRSSVCRCLQLWCGTVTSSPEMTTATVYGVQGGQRKAARSGDGGAAAATLEVEIHPPEPTPIPPEPVPKPSQAPMDVDQPVSVRVRG